VWLTGNAKQAVNFGALGILGPTQAIFVLLLFFFFFYLGEGWGGGFRSVSKGIGK
jgi:hypothetical protein